MGNHNTDARIDDAHIDLLVEESLRRGILTQRDLGRHASREHDIETINRITLALPFDYSSLLQEFNRLLPDIFEQNTATDAFYNAIRAEPSGTMARFSTRRTGATCLAGCAINSAVFRKFGYDCTVQIAAKRGDRVSSRQDAESQVHYVAVVKEPGRQHYLDSSLNLLKPIDLTLGRNEEEQILDIALVRRKECYDVVLAKTRYLWSFTPDSAERPFSEHARLMADSLNPMKRADPLQYLRLNTLVSSKDAAFIIPPSDNTRLLRLKVSYDTNRRAYFLQLANKERQFVKTYDLAHREDDFNSIDIRKAEELSQDLEQVAHISLGEEFFEDLNTLNRKLATYKKNVRSIPQ